MIYKSFTLKSSREGVTWFVTAKNQADQTDIIITHNAIEMRAVKEAKTKIDERTQSEMDTIVLVIDEKLTQKLKQLRWYENAGQPDTAKINTDTDLIIQLINNAHDAMKLTKLGQKVLE